MPKVNVASAGVTVGLVVLGAIVLALVWIIGYVYLSRRTSRRLVVKYRTLAQVA